MRIIETIIDFFGKNSATTWHMPTIGASDVIEMLIIAFLLYKVMAWMKDTRAWALFKGLVFVAFVHSIASKLQHVAINRRIINKVPLSSSPFWILS